MSTRLSALLTGLRDRLDAVSGIPSARAWDNAETTPATGTSYVSDRLELVDTRPAALGSGALKRSDFLYRVRIHVPAGASALPALDAASRVVDAFLDDTTPITIDGRDAEITDGRSDPPIRDDAWYVIPIQLIGWVHHS